MRHYLAVIAFVTIVHLSDAQLIRSFGIKAGTVLAGQNWDYSPSSPLAGMGIADQMRWGADVGCFVEWLDNPTLSLLTEMHYLERGFQDELFVTSPTSPEIIGTKVLKPRLAYLSIPVLMKVRLQFASVSPYLMAGPRYDLLLSKNPDSYDFVIDHVKDYDWGLSLGAGFEYDISPSYDLGAEVRYEMSLQDIYKTDMLTVRNHSIQFLAYVAF